MDFFERQEKARSNTTRLVIYFLLGVGLMLAAVYLVFAFSFQFDQFDKRGLQGLWNAQLFMWVSLGTLAVIGGGSLFKTLELALAAAPSPARSAENPSTRTRAIPISASSSTWSRKWPSPPAFQSPRSI